ncbi:MAG: DUF58 domain-containing protein [Bdellovibrionota bacterium]
MTKVPSELLREAHKRALEATSVLQVEFGNLVRSGLVGNWLGRDAGSSIDFHEHRSYSPGDDPRHIDWRVFARTGHYMMKQFREEISPSVDILVDPSPSMTLGAEKLMRTLEIIYFAVEAASAAQASVRCSFLGGINRILDISDLENYTMTFPEGRNDLALNEQLVNAPIRRASLRFLISDLLFPGSPESSLGLLTGRAGRAILFVPFCNDEARPSWNGSIEFTDCESQLRREQIVDQGILERYLNAYDTHFQYWREAANRFRVPLVRVCADDPLISALSAESVPGGALRLWG